MSVSIGLAAHRHLGYMWKFPALGVTASQGSNQKLGFSASFAVETCDSDPPIRFTRGDLTQEGRKLGKEAMPRIRGAGEGGNGGEK